MKIRKWTYELIAVVVVLLIGGAGWWFNSTKDERQASAQYEQLLKFANRQAVEIAIIEQASKLEDYKQQMAASQQARNLAVTQPVLPPAITPPIIADSKDVDVNKIP